MKRAAVLCAVLGAALFIAGICLRGIAGDAVTLVLAGGGAVMCVAGCVWLFAGRHQAHCPNCGAAINTGPYMGNLYELSRTGTLKCPNCGSIISNEVK